MQRRISARDLNSLYRICYLCGEFGFLQKVGSNLLSQSGPLDFIRFLAYVHHHDKGKGHLATHLMNPNNAKTLAV